MRKKKQKIEQLGNAGGVHYIDGTGPEGHENNAPSTRKGKRELAKNLSAKGSRRQKASARFRPWVRRRTERPR